MVNITQERISSDTLSDITRREVAQYAGFSPLAKLYPLLDDANRTYAVVLIRHDRAVEPPSIVVIARVVDDHIIIEEDTTDKPLVDALIVNGGVPREQIVLAYAGEALPAADEA